MASEKPFTEFKSRTPKLSVTLVTTLVCDLYGLDVQSCQELDSFMDRNYHVKVDVSNVHNQHVGQICPHGYVLKILNSEDSKDPADVRTETALIQHVHGKSKGQGLCTPRVVPTIHGLPFVMCSLDLDTDNHKIVTESGGKQHAIRLLEYMPGSALVTLPLSPRLAFQLGHCAATLDTMLQDFDDSNDKVPGENYYWNMENLPSLRHLLDVIKDHELRGIISDVIDAFETKVLESDTRQTLKRGYIHGDFNLHNILVSRTSDIRYSPPESRSSSVMSTSSDTALSPSSKTSPPSASSSSSSPSSSSPPPSSISSLSLSLSDDWNVNGVVDFGDVTKTYVILELAIAMCDAMMCCPVDCDPDVIAGHVLAGYLSQMMLNRQETEVLPLAVGARMAQILVMSYQTLVRDPFNHYILSFIAPVQRQLPRFWKIPADVILTVWQDVSEKHGIKFPTT